jgi:hypothetical protein
MTHTPATLAAAFNEFGPLPIRDRAVERQVTLHEDANGAKTLAVFTTGHDKDGKVFRGSVRIVRQDPPRDGSMFIATTWIPFERSHNRRLPNIPVARYSDKALAAAAQENLDMLVAEPDWLDSLDLGPYNASL